MEDQDSNLTAIFEALDAGGYDDVLVLDKDSSEEALTARRRELITAISDHQDLNVSELADVVDRQVSAVSRDLEILYKCNIISFENSGRSKTPILNHQTIMTRPFSVNDCSGEELDTVMSDLNSKSQSEFEGHEDDNQLEASGDIRSETASTVLTTKVASDESLDTTDGFELITDEYIDDIIKKLEAVEEWKLISKGEYSNVYKIIRNDDLPSVIKIPRNPENERAVKLISAEKNSLLRFGPQTNIPNLLSSGDEPVPWIEMEFISGETLEESDPLTIERATQILQMLFQTLERAHDNDTPHGDIKPGNIMVPQNSEATAKVIDWGTGLAYQDSISTVAFTPAYAPPEVHRSTESADAGDSIDYKLVDVYQMGLLAYEVLTGERPYFNAGFQSTQTIVGSSQPWFDDDHQPLPPSFVNQSLPEALDQVLLRAMSTDPLERYESIAELNQAFTAKVEESNLAANDAVCVPTINRESIFENSEELAEIYCRFAKSMGDKGDSETAQKYFEVAIENAPDNPEIHRVYADYLQTIGELEPAGSEYRKALTLDPENAGIHNNYANLLQKQGDYNKAEEHYKKAIELDPEGVEPQNNLAVLKTEEDDPEQAEEWFETLLESAVDQSEIYNNYANLLTHKGEPEKALDMYEQAIELDQYNAEAYYNLANLYKTLDNTEKAREYYEKGRELDNSLPPAKFSSLLKNQPVDPNSTTQTTVAAM